MQNESKIDADQLQRLIDGELPEAQICAMFEIAAQNPSHWRTIACAFTEDKLFSREFESMTDDLDSKPAKHTHAASRGQSASGALLLMRQLAIAASVAVAGLIGYLVGTDGSVGETNAPTNITNLVASNEATETDQVNPATLEPEYRMELLTPDGETLNEVDLYRYDDLHQLVSHGNDNRRVTLRDILPDSGVSPEVRRRFSQSGFDINESTNFMSGRLQDGRQFVVPVRSIRFDQGH